MWNLRNNRVRKATVLIALLIAIGSIALVIFLTPAREVGPGIELHRGTGRMPQAAFSVFNFIPRNWGWAWKIKQRLFGVPRPIRISAEGFLLRGPEKEVFLGLLPGEANQTADRIKAWRFEQADEKALAGRIREIFTGATEFSGRITTGDRMEASLSQTHSTRSAAGTTVTGNVFRTLPKLTGHGIELNAEIEQTEQATSLPGKCTTATNLAVSIRTLMSSAGAVLILAPLNDRSTNTSVGILISAQAGLPR